MLGNYLVGDLLQRLFIGGYGVSFAVFTSLGMLAGSLLASKGVQNSRSSM